MAGNRVNPPKQVVLPAKVQSDRELKKAFDDVYLIMFQMWKRLGGGDDWINALQEDEYEFDQLIEPDVSQFLLSDIVITDSDYTTHGNQVVICTGRVTVTLNDEPSDQEVVKVRMLSNGVTINGNGKNVNGQSDAKIKIKYTSWDLLYILETDEWIIV